GVEVRGLTGVDLAEVAAAGALGAADQERGLPVLPALEDVRAAGLLADGVQPFPLHQRPQLGVLRAHGGAGLDPVGLPLVRRRVVAGLHAKHLASFRSDSHYSLTFRRGLSLTLCRGGARCCWGTTW